MKKTMALLVLANLAAWALALGLFHARPVLLGLGLLAWVFGLRHAVDADHIAAIDNVVRKLMSQHRPARAVGLWFSLGHSTIVVMASLAIAVTAAALKGRLEAAANIGSIVGTIISALFLLVIAVLNLLVLRGVWADFKRVKAGGEARHAALPGGVLAHLLAPLFRLVSASWQMYFVGFLFGLGFDTATEVGLLGISATQAGQGMPAWEVMVFPALFTAGMALVDTADSVLMVRAYGWALVNPLRKLWYNFTITAVSVLVALLIGGVEALDLLGDHLNLAGPFWGWLDQVNGDSNFSFLGFGVVGLFVLCWVVSAVVYRWQGWREAEPPPPSA
jgi:high-affinity nickel-transport protein